jgi:alpha-glucuronidase
MNHRHEYDAPGRRVRALAWMLVLFAHAHAADGLVGRWTFDDGTGREVSGLSSDMVVGPAQVHSLGAGKACLRLVPGKDAAVIPVRAGSPLAIERGTVCFWLNVGETSSGTIMEFDNRAVEMRVYRSHFQPRFRGEGKFNFGSGLLGRDWPNFLLRESAFYPHERAVTGEGVWHHFAVAYDVEGRRIVGWRDGERISVVDLSTAGMEPLRREGLTAVAVGADLSGFLDELRLYSRPLGDDEVRRIHAAEREAFAGRNDAVAASRELRVYSYEEQDRSLYRAWLQHRTVDRPKSPEITRCIIADGENPTVRNAARELSAALTEMLGPATIYSGPQTGPRIVLGTPDTSAWIREHADVLGLKRIQHDGYVLKAIPENGHAVAVIAAGEPGGVVAGVFDLLRRLQLGADPAQLDHVSSPSVPIRIVNHWDIWRGCPHDDWRVRDTDEADTELNRSNSIYSWDELRRGDTRRIRDWARLLASAGWNAVCPTEINWEFRNNFLDHLDEVKVLAGIFREYGIRLYWSPNYLLALRRETADRLYAAVPDFGGYLLKLGSEAQEGDPRPAMVNQIAGHLAPHGGHALVRAFVYGKYRYSSDDIRNLNPYDIIAAEDGNYRSNVVLVSKGSPLDWDFSAPIPALDGSIQRNTYGTELVIAKHWPLSWVEKWKWWLEQDNYRQGPGSLNKFNVRCILGVAMINPAPGWTACPLNMVNYYGLGRLAENPNRTVDEIYTEWIRLTFGDDPDVLATVKTILLLSDDITRKLYIYRGYRGVWIDRRDAADLVQNKTPHTLTRDGVGVATPELRERVLAQYAPGLREIYADLVRGEEFFASFNFAPLDHQLTSGRTVIQDLFGNLDDAVQLAAQLPELWLRLEGKIDTRRFRLTLETLNEFARTAARERAATIKGIESVTRRRHDITMAELAPARRANRRFFDVRDFGAQGNGTGDNAHAIEAAITACHAAGGGTVFVPAGIFVTGSIRLRSNVTLALDTGAVLRATASATNAQKSDTGGRGRDTRNLAPLRKHSPLLRGEGLENVRVLGPGTLAGVASARESEASELEFASAIALESCRGVEVRNLNIEHAARTGMLVVGCTDVVIDNVTLHTPRDGINLQRCQNVVVANCHIYSVRYEDGVPMGGGEAIVLGGDDSRSGLDPETEITIRNCAIVGGPEARRFGPETFGQFGKVRAENNRWIPASAPQ